jgi:hypothetical protein
MDLIDLYKDATASAVIDHFRTLPAQCLPASSVEQVGTNFVKS